MKIKAVLVNSFLLILTIQYLYAQDWHSHTTENSGLVSNTVRTICIDIDGDKWFGTDSGLSRFNGTTWSMIVKDTAKKTLAHNSIRDIALEVTGYGPEIWIATDAGVSVMGIKVDAVSKATPYRQENTDLICDTVNTVFVDSNHTKWFGTKSGLSRFSGSSWSSFTINDLLSDNQIISIGTDAESWKYFGTEGGGVTRLIDNNVDAITAASPYDYAWSSLSSDSVLAIYILNNGNQWFGTDNGVCFHEGSATESSWTNYTNLDGLVNNHV